MLYSGSQASVIRNLSVFISHLESMARPDQASFSFFSRAAAVFSRIIDEILEPHLEVSVGDRNIDTDLEMDLNAPFSLDLEGMQLLENIDFTASLARYYVEGRTDEGGNGKGEKTVFGLPNQSILHTNSIWEDISITSFSEYRLNAESHGVVFNRGSWIRAFSLRNGSRLVAFTSTWPGKC